MESETKPRCIGCAFWRQDRASDFGECRRHPPLLMPTLLPPAEELGGHGGGQDTRHLEYATRFPVTFCEDDCGEHRPRD